MLFLKSAMYQNQNLLDAQITHPTKNTLARNYELSCLQSTISKTKLLMRYEKKQK